jgi:hypothetical protein
VPSVPLPPKPKFLAHGKESDEWIIAITDDRIRQIQRGPRGPAQNRTRSHVGAFPNREAINHNPGLFTL